MSAAELVEQFRRLPAAEQREVILRLRDECGDELTPELVAKFEERAEWLRRHPGEGIAWPTIQAERKNRRRKISACAGK